MPKHTTIKPGKRFTYLEVLSQDSRTESGHAIWRCRCICGQETLVRGCNLVSNNTRSCGCKRKRDRTAHKNWRGCGDIPMKVWKSIQRNATRRGFAFLITLEETWELFVSQRGICALSGLPIHFADSIREHNSGETTASLDRVDSDVGYVKGNIQWVHKDVNMMKSNYPQEYFLSMCRHIASHQHKVTE